MNIVSFQKPTAPLELWLEYCAARGLTHEVLAPLNGELLTLEQASKIVGTGIFGFKSVGAVGAYVFQLAKDEYQARVIYDPDKVDAIQGVGENVKPKKAPKYFRSKNSANVLFVPPHLTDWTKPDVRYNLLVVEGALNATRLAAQGYHAVAITGVYNYRTGGKHTPIIPELVRFAQSTQAERITILFDSDTGDPDENKGLWVGFHNLAQDLMKLRLLRRDSIYSCRPPAKPNGEKNGPDDYLHSAGFDAFNELLRDQSEKYSDNPYLIREQKIQATFINDKLSGRIFDCETRQLITYSHAEHSMMSYGEVEDITANRPVKSVYTLKKFIAAPGTRHAYGIAYRPDLDDIYFSDDSTPPRFYINKFQPEDVTQAIKGDCSIAYRMLNSICRDTPSGVNKLLIIAAMHAQNPALMPKYAILLTGQQGSGKSLLAKLLGLSLAKKFNSARVDLRVAYNSDWRGFAAKEWPEFDKDMDEEMLKDLITGGSYLVSTKYGHNYEEQNHTLNIFTCNGLRSKIQPGDRRFLVCGEAKADNKELGLEFEAWVNGMGPSHFRYHLLNDIDCSGYDLLNVWTEMKDAVIEASKSFRSTVCDYVVEELEQVEGLECVPNTILQTLLDPHKVGIISFNKEFGQTFIKPAKEVVKIDGVLHRFRAYKNYNKWRKEDNTDEYRKQFELAKQLLTKKF